MQRGGKVTMNGEELAERLAEAGIDHKFCKLSYIRHQALCSRICRNAASYKVAIEEGDMVRAQEIVRRIRKTLSEIHKDLRGGYHTPPHYLSDTGYLVTVYLTGESQYGMERWRSDAVGVPGS